MPAPAIPSNFDVQTADAKVFLSWSLVSGATTYSVQRSTDGVTFTTLTSPSTNYYLDTTGTVGTRYYYKVASTGTGGTSSYTSATLVIPCPPGEVSLFQIRTLSKQRADRVNSNFVTLPEWNEFIRLAYYELYDLLIAADEDYAIASPLQITLQSGVSTYALPNGINNSAAQALYKLKGVDLSAAGGLSSTVGWVTLKKFNFAERNKYFFPTMGAQAYGMFNAAYRMLGSNIEIIPTPSSGVIQLWYVPRLPQLLDDTDTTSISVSGWIQYVIDRAAKYALDKEESDTSKIDEEILFLKKRIEAMAQNRDAGQPDTISDTRDSGWGWPGNGFQGGY